MICNDLMCGDGNLESAQPTRELIQLAGMVHAEPALLALITETEAEDCFEALRASPFKEFTQRIEHYIDRYGHRCMSEMKLEQRDLHQDPSFLFVCLKNYLRAGQIDLEAYEAGERAIRQRAEQTVFTQLKGLRRRAYQWSLKHARRAVRNRENTRFCRTRVYGIVRRMFFAMGREFTLRGLLEAPEDIFYLTLDELRGTFDAVLPCQDVAALVATRKKAFQGYQDKEPASRFSTRGPVYWGNNHFPEEHKPDENLPANCLKGIGCCPGVREGVVKVILSPNDNLELNGEILVTMRTDPGWIPLYPAISGLLVERGGLLSHSAIVAREMGLPTVVSVPGLTQRIKNGMRVRLDGQSGLIEILEE
jgi:pyruvate,water dikinase